MRKSFGIAFSLLLFATWASAQVPSGNVFFGYSFENTNSSSLNLNLSRFNLHGWEASVEGKVLPWVGIVGDFSGHYGSQTFPVPDLGTVKVTGHQQEFLFGPRLSVSVGKLTPFGELLIGAAHMGTGGFFSSTNTSFASAVGGGVDYKIIRPLAWRFQGDYIHTHFFGNGQNNLRLSTGVVVRF